MTKSILKKFLTKTKITTASLILCATTFLFLSSASAIDYPAKITAGPASAKINTHETIIQNNVLHLKLDTSKNKLKLTEITDKCSDSTLKNHDGELFTITVNQYSAIACSKMRLQGKLTSQQVSAIPDSPNLAERYPGKKLQAQLVSKNENLLIDWSLLLRDDSNYIRQIIDIKPTDTEIIIKSIIFTDFYPTRQENLKVCRTVRRCGRGTC